MKEKKQCKLPNQWLGSLQKDLLPAVELKGKIYIIFF
jgi:hypothetical protein